MKYIAVKNFERFQHYRDRRPPWIKLYVELLDDYEFTSLNDDVRFHLIGLWILASKCDNRIPRDERWIQNAIRSSKKPNINALITAGWLVPHEEAESTGKVADWSSRYVSREMRAAVIAKSNGLCVLCGSSDKIEIDHITPISRGGTGEESNLQALCRACNRRKRTSVGSAGVEHVATQMRSTEPDMRSLETETKREGEEREKQTPPTREVSIAEESLALQCGEHYPAVVRFLDARPRDKRDEWAADLLRLIGPATGNLPEDLARACTDGHLAEPPVTNALTLRIFVASCKAERRRVGVEPIHRASGDGGEAGQMFAAIRGLVTEIPNPGRGIIRAIPKAKVADLGDRALAAYEQVGGAERFLDQTEKVGFLLRDFTNAYNANQRQSA